MKKTHRGFGIYSEFTDTYGTKIRIQESSSVLPRVWIFTKNKDDGKTDLVGMDGKPFFQSLHLSVGQAKRVVKALTKFINENSK